MLDGRDGAPPSPTIIGSVGWRSQISNGRLPSPGHGLRIGRSNHREETESLWQPEVARVEAAPKINSIPGIARAAGAVALREELAVMAPSSGIGEESMKVVARQMSREESSSVLGHVRSGKGASRELEKFWRRVNLGVGQIVHRAGRRLEGFTLPNCDDFLGGMATASNELQKLRNRAFGGLAAATREDEFSEGGPRHRRRKKNSVQFVVASRSLQASSSGRGVLASTAATLGEIRCRRSGKASATSSAQDSVLDNSLSVDELLRHPLAIVSLVPKSLSLFFAGALAGAAAKTVTAPLDRIKLLMQVHGVQAAQNGVKSSMGFIEAIVKIGTQEGLKGYWKGNLPQVIRVIPYSAVQLFAYENYKRILKGDNPELSVLRRLVAGACAGMTSTLVTYPLDTLRLRIAVDPASKSMGQVIVNMMKQEGLASFYCGLGPSLLGIAPYIALNFCVFDLVKKSLPEEVRKRPEASLVTALVSASFATVMCYPLDTVRRVMQMKGTPYKSVADAFPGIIAREGVVGLYRGFLPNALKTLPSSSIRLTTFDAAKNLINASDAEYERLLNGKPKTSDSQGDGIEEEKTRRD